MIIPHSQAIVAGGASAFPAETLVVVSSACANDMDAEGHDFGGELRVRSGAGWAAPPRPRPDLVLEAKATLTDAKRPVRLTPYPKHFTNGDLLVDLPEQDVFYAGGILFDDVAPFGEMASAASTQLLPSCTADFPVSTI